jgi:hypothetical protein
VSDSSLQPIGIPHIYNDVLILQRGDGYWNATAMCRACGAEWSGYLRNQSTDRFLRSLERSLQICRDQLVQTISNGPNPLRGTWVHRRVAIHLAQWLDPEFAVLVSGWVEELFTRGHVEITPAQRAWSERLERFVLAHRVHVVRDCVAGSWSVFTATVTEVLVMEDEFLRHCLPLKGTDLPDGSIGQRYVGHREGEPWVGPIRNDIPLQLPQTVGSDGQPRVVYPNVYGPDELRHFQQWLHGTYLPANLPQYLTRKFKPRDFGLTPVSAADHGCRRLTGSPARLAPADRRRLELVGGFAPFGTQLPGPQQGGLFDGIE